jgi:TatD DNase family protein
MLVDFHAHLDHFQFEKDLDEVINRAKNVTIISAGISPKTNRIVLELSKKYENVKACLGIYPIQALEAEIKKGEYPINPESVDIEDEIKFIKKNKDKIVAIGEVGLDYAFVPETANSQKELFQKFIELAEKLNKPIVVHSRKAEEDVVNMLQSSKLKKVVLHCFCGKQTLVKKAIDLDFNFTIPTNVVRSQQMQKLAELTNINKMLTETDSPYLSPFPGKRNEPSFIIEAVKKIAEIKKMDVLEVENNIYKNYLSLV